MSRIIETVFSLDWPQVRARLSRQDSERSAFLPCLCSKFSERARPLRPLQIRRYCEEGEEEWATAVEFLDEEQGTGWVRCEMKRLSLSVVDTTLWSP